MLLDNQWLKNEIDKLGFYCTPSFFPEKNKECLSVFLPVEEDDVRLMQVWLEPQADDAYSQNLNSEALSLMHLFMPVCLCKKNFMLDAANLIFIFNSSMSVPGFSISLIDKHIYYHSTTFMGVSQGLDIFKSMTQIAVSYMNAFSTILTPVAGGQKTSEIALREFFEANQS